MAEPIFHNRDAVLQAAATLAAADFASRLVASGSPPSNNTVEMLVQTLRDMVTAGLIPSAFIPPPAR